MNKIGLRISNENGNSMKKKEEWGQWVKPTR